ncbi:hypothetical protein P472_02932 [Mycobacterium tuberculosis TKK_03_0029]|nr:hypothetical protein P472_02932 [Mycobacterium tuberculosis TKK_03_0029]
MLATIFAVVVLIVVRPKTPRGDGNLNTEPCTCRGSGVSSDPKPREGTETMLATIFAVVVLIVVRPKTPRGDGNCS